VTSAVYPAATRPLRFSDTLNARNRLYFAPMGLDLCGADGQPTPAFHALYGALMDGGCGFGFLGNASVDASSRYNGRGLKLTSAAHADALRPLFEVARRHAFPLGVQLQHYGPQGMPAQADGVLLSPSGVPSPSTLRKFPDARTVAMTDAQIHACIEQFATAARHAHDAGAPLIQLQASNGYLISSFLSPRTNLRTDAWGGSPLARARFLLAIVERIRAVTNGAAAVTVRLGIDDGLDDGQRPEFLADVVAALEEAGVAAITCSIGVSETFRTFFGEQSLAFERSRHGCRFLKQFTRVPVGFTGSVADVATAERLIADGDADFVGFARAVLADNQLVAKELAGRADSVHRCQWDARCFRDKREPLADRVYCCVNPAYPRPDALQQHYERNPG
jgi:2,4-dienoyl-CoA reductase-like NADH-dependent reductase (Old Yellow Enzyme family)